MKWIVEAETIDDIVLGHYEIDLDPLTECKDCKYRGMFNYCVYKTRLAWITGNNDYCSKGRRREE